MVVVAVLSSCGARVRREAALQTIAEADSLRAKGVLYSDTAKLNEAANALCHYTHRIEKAKALYYLGRNYSAEGKDDIAADCYINADRLRPDDPELLGRIISNMAYICAQQDKDSLAIIFREKAIAYFRIANDTLNYILSEMDQEDLEVVKTWRLNERHYGALQGLNKKETADK